MVRRPVPESVMPAALRRLSLGLALLALAACSQEKRSGEPRMPADEPEAAEHPTGISAAEGYRAQSSPAKPAGEAAEPNAPSPATFACTGGAKIVVDGNMAIVTLPDARVVKVPRAPDDADAYRGEALGFRIKDGQGDLSQDEVGTFHCSAG